MICCYFCRMNILLVGAIPFHGEIDCTECNGKNYYIGKQTVPFDWVKINHDDCTINLDPPEEFKEKVEAMFDMRFPK